MSTSRDYYEILGVDRNASAEEIKKAFRQKARTVHPDVNKEENAEAQFKELGEAYEVLSDEQKRQVYDTYGHAGLQGGGYQPSWEFMDGFPDLSDLFAQFFGGGFAPRGHQQGGRGGAMRGADLQYDLDIEFMDAVVGCKKDIEVPQLCLCDTCNGSGASPESGGPVPCQTCMGQGQIRQTTQTIIGHFTQIGPCPRCYGSGAVIMDPCKACSGKGRRRKNKTLSITVPIGVDTGTRLRMSGEGDAGVMGGPPGDLYVMIHVKDHASFKRDGFDVHSTVSVTYSQLALGDEVDVQGIHTTERVKIPAGTPSGTVFTIKGKGIPVLNANHQRGNHYVYAVLEVPKHLSGEERKLVEKLAELEKQRQGKSTKTPSHATGSLASKFRTAFAGS